MLDKQSIRKYIKQERASLSKEQVSYYSNQISHHIFKLEEFKLCKTLFLYSSIGNEVETRQIAEDALKNNKKIAYPKTNLKTKEMEFYYVDQLNQLTRGKVGSFSLLEPQDNQSNKVTPNQDTLIIVPGLAFDQHMYRIGYGGGFYDKYLQNYPSAVTVGICYDFQIIDNVLPENHDIPLQHIITPTKHIIGGFSP